MYLTGAVYGWSAAKNARDHFECSSVERGGDVDAAAKNVRLRCLDA